VGKLIDEVVNGGKIFADTGDEASQNLEIKDSGHYTKNVMNGLMITIMT
jgi:hypothetical protein